jgi:hypothetical protein
VIYEKYKFDEMENGKKKKGNYAEMLKGKVNIHFVG